VRVFPFLARRQMSVEEISFELRASGYPDSLISGICAHLAMSKV
jgi:hypothetical protein